MTAGDSHPIAILTEESERRLEGLRRGLRRSKSIALYIVLASDAALFEVLRRLRTWSGSGGVPELYFFPDGKETAPAIERLLAEVNSAQPLAGAVVPEASALLDAGSESTIAALNSARDYLGKLIHGPLVLVLPAKRAPALALAAPDLVDVRSMSVEIDATPVDLSATEAGLRFDEAAVPSLRDGDGEARSPFELQKEAARLRALGASAEPPPPGALADVWLKIGWEFFKAQEPGEARAAAEESRRLAESIKYDLGIANALVLEADVLWQGGRAEASEHALRRAVELTRKLGLERSVARALSRLGEVLSRTGRSDDAETVLREAANLSEKHGEARDHAFSLSTIASILATRGQLDEALRIRNDEELPAYERVGDVRNLLIGRANLALTYLMRGQPGDREKAAELLRLARAAAEAISIPKAKQIRALQRRYRLADD